jgi:hypothetical protein
MLMGQEMGGQLLLVKEVIEAYVNVLLQNSIAQIDKNHEETPTYLLHAAESLFRS